MITRRIAGAMVLAIGLLAVTAAVASSWFDVDPTTGFGADLRNP